MRRILILGRGGAGKSTLAARFGATLALPVIELDKHFWAPDLTPLPKDEWVRVQRELTGGPRWVIDGDLGPYDVLDVRLRAADAVVVLDFPLWRCAAHVAPHAARGRTVPRRGANTIRGRSISISNRYFREKRCRLRRPPLRSHPRFSTQSISRRS